MDYKNLKHIYFLGIGGIGMSALARYFHALGIQVSGYDKTQTALCQQLHEEGMRIHFEDKPENLPPNIDMVIFTPAIPKDLGEFQKLSSSNITLKKRSEVLGDLSAGLFTIAVAGTHGKTSISSIIAHILQSSGKNICAFVGGIMNNYKSNFIGGHNPQIMLVEADEFDKSFLRLKPDIALISSMDADHLDIYKTHESLTQTFQEFAGGTKKGGKLILKKGLNIQPSEGQTDRIYSLDEKTDFRAEKIRIENNIFVFDLILNKIRIKDIRFPVPGNHNVENAVAAATVAYELGIYPMAIKKALETYKGVKRRFEYKIRTRNLVYIDDYAHHPEELRACISSVRKLYPKKRITGIFQPHLFSRTKDFAAGFAKSLDLLDDIVLLDIYPAREEPIPGITSEIIFDQIKNKNKILLDKKELLELVANKKIEVLLTLGAGDIDKFVEPIQKLLSE
jgi:UDP-N-acetylmuramate--alanine ligase